MDLEKLQEDIKNSYNTQLPSVDERISETLKHLQSKWQLEPQEMSLHEIKTLTNTVLDVETQRLHDEVDALLAQKEQIERSLERKADDLQQAKYKVFNAFEAHIGDDEQVVSKLHQVKLQSIDLYDLLGEMVESAIITALEKDKDGNISDTTEEIIKEITYEAIKEGSLNTIRIRKILSTILQSAVDIAEASPNRAQEILSATLKGMRSGLVHSIDRFKKRLAFMPVEAKHILIEDYDTIMEDLNQTDVLFSQVIQTKANESSKNTRELLLKINQDMHYDLEELIHISKEAADIMRERFSSFAKNAVKKGEEALHSPAAKEAKRMGVEAWSLAKNALGSAIKSAKDAIDTKEK